MSPGASTLLLEEHFSEGADAFLPELLACDSSSFLASFAAKWFIDPRPWARAQLLAFIDDGCDRAGHRPLVKRLYKAAEASDDGEVVAHFVVAFDRLLRRRLALELRYDWTVRGTVELKRLVNATEAPKNQPAAQRDRTTRSPQTGEAIQRPGRPAAKAEIFSRATRAYLRRRALRYLRKLGSRDLAAYLKHACTALRLYRDENLATPEALLDAWGLCHLLYWGSPVLSREVMGIVVAPGHSLAELQPAPMHPEAWVGQLAALLDLLIAAGARPVRLFALGKLRAEHGEKLKTLGLEQILQLLRAGNDDSRALGLELFRTAPGLSTLPIATWLELLALADLELLPQLCALVETNVAPSRLSFAQCLELAKAPTAPVAALGLRWAKDKPIQGTAEDRRRIFSLVNAPLETIRAAAVAWSLELIRSPIGTDLELRELLDSRFEDVRAVAIAALHDDAEPRFSASTLLWAALSESPHADAREALIARLEHTAIQLDPSSVKHLWRSTLLAVRTGGRARREVAAQVARRIAQKPAEADELLPLLGIVLRSLRVPERAHALAQLAQAAWKVPGLQASIEAKFPELKLGAEVSG